jgi:hypothetical protein
MIVVFLFYFKQAVRPRGIFNFYEWQSYVKVL